MAPDGRGNVYVAWTDERHDPGDVFAGRSSDAGQTWSPSNRVNEEWNATRSDHAALAIEEATVHALWIDGDVYHARSSDGGAAWGGTTRIAAGLAGGEAVFLSVATGPPQVLYAIWLAERWSTDRGIYFARSVDSGATWSEGRKLAEGVSGIRAPTIAVDPKGTALVAYAIPIGGGHDILLNRSSDGGVNWSLGLRVNDEPASPVAFVAAGSSSIYVMWESIRRGYSPQLRFSKSVDAGASWSASLPVDNREDLAQFGEGFAIGPDEAMYALWADERRFALRNLTVSMSEDGGQRWSRFRVNDVPEMAAGPADLAVDSTGTVYAVWEDYRNGDADIYAGILTTWPAGTWIVPVALVLVTSTVGLAVLVTLLRRRRRKGVTPRAPKVPKEEGGPPED